MTDQKAKADEPEELADAASKRLQTDFGDEGQDVIGAEHDGPIKAPDAEGGAYVIP